MNETPKAQPKLRSFSRNSLKSSMLQKTWKVCGRVTEVKGTVIEVNMSHVQVGTQVQIHRVDYDTYILGEVIGFSHGQALVLPYHGVDGVALGCSVETTAKTRHLAVHDDLLGQVIDPFLEPLNGKKLHIDSSWERIPVDREAPNPMERKRIEKPLCLGVKAMDGLLTFGDGQRIGVMAGSGVGKSVLMGMIARSSDADINVIGLIGERGREVREFIERDLGEEGLKKSVVVVVTGDQSPLMKIRAAKVVTSIAEYFSSKGKSVMLMMDSLTRVAMAQREIGLAAGEPPSSKGYTPSVFSLLPKILERTGPQKEGRGNISCLYTVLVDGDDFNDPIADTTRGILDGHINLSRKLAAKGHFPAIDVATSTSRVMNEIVANEHWTLSNHIKGLMGTYMENIDLVQIGAYQPGSNPKLDEALYMMPKIEHFLKQDMNENSNFENTIKAMFGMFIADEENQANHEV